MGAAGSPVTGSGGSRIPGRAGPPFCGFADDLLFLQMMFKDSLTIVDDFVRILERVSRYFGDIYRFNIKIMKIDSRSLI